MRKHPSVLHTLVFFFFPAEHCLTCLLICLGLNHIFGHQAFQDQVSAFLAPPGTVDNSLLEAPTPFLKSSAHTILQYNDLLLCIHFAPGLVKRCLRPFYHLDWIRLNKKQAGSSQLHESMSSSCSRQWIHPNVTWHFSSSSADRFWRYLPAISLSLSWIAPYRDFLQHVRWWLPVW